jgi:hypothetical protein
VLVLVELLVVVEVVVDHHESRSCSSFSFFNSFCCTFGVVWWSTCKEVEWWS